MAGRRPYAALDVSVVIVNYNVRDFLHQALGSLQRSLKGFRSEIIVVDNASDDGSVEMMHRKFPKITCIANTTNLGFAKANNLALDRCKGKFILLINPDTIVQEDTIRVMLNFMKTHPDAGMAGCKILNPDGSLEPACRRSFPTPWVAFTKISGLSKLFPQSKFFSRYNLSYLDPEKTYPVEAISGSFMMVRKEMIGNVGGLDEKFFMYGEDLDWCYRIHQAGWKIYYVHSTQIIHYKGESTKRSSIDEIKTFYEAMRLFVKKHFHSSSFFSLILRISISAVSFTAFLSAWLKPLRIAFFDFLTIGVSLLLAEEIWKGGIFRYPAYAYPVVFTIPAIIVIVCLYAAGVYTQRRMSISRSITATFIAYILISALTAFFKDYAFSRMIVAISGGIAVILIPGWRLFLRLLGKTRTHGRGTLFGRRTLIVGTDSHAITLLKKMRTRVGEGYEIIGFIGTTHKYVGDSIEGIPVLGSIDNVGKTMREHGISDVIFSPRALSYTQILSVISKNREQTVGFHLVPSTMEVIVGKASVDSLDNLPLVQIVYNIDKPLNRFTKRIFDIVISGLLFITIYPIFQLIASKSKKNSSGFMKRIPQVLTGKLSLVGRFVSHKREIPSESDQVFLGKPGLCGLVQLQEGRKLSDDEMNQYDLYYARNQSVLFDMEILMKTWLRERMRRNTDKRNYAG